jgi:hypothetical protein
VATLKEQQELIKLLEKEEEQRIKIERLKGEAISKLEIQARLLAVQAEEQERLIDLLSLDEGHRQRALDLESDQIDALVKKGKISLKLGDQMLKSIMEIVAVEESDVEALKAQLASKQALLTQQLKNNAAIRDGATAAEQMADSFARAVGFGPSLTKNILDAAKAGGSLNDIYEKAGQSLKKSFSKEGVLAFAINNTAQLLKSFDEITAGLAASTGQGRDFAGVVEQAFSNTSDFATTLEDTAASVDGLFHSFVGFTNLSEAAKTSLVESATLMEKIGISAEETGERLTFFTTVLKMSKIGAENANNEIIRLAVGLGQGPKSLSAQFNQLIPQLSLFGKTGPEVFKKTAIAARQFGLDMNTGAQDLFNLTQGLQDFESAASKVATINVVLGGSFVNAFDLVMAAGKGPVAQVELLQDAFRQADKNMDDMGFHERKLLADDLGISFGNLQKIMEGQKLTEEDMLSTEEQMMKAMKDTASMMDQMNSAIQTLSASLTPLLQALTPVIQTFTTFVKFGGDVLLVMASIGTAAMILAKKIGVVNATVGTLAGTVGFAFAGFAGGYILIKKLGDYLTGPWMTALAVMAATAGVALLTFGGPLGAGLGVGLLGFAAALGLGAAGVISTGAADTKPAETGPSIGSFADFKMGSSVNDAIVQEGKITPIHSKDKAITMLAKPGGAIDLSAEKSQNQPTSGTDLSPQMAQMTDTMNKFIAAANKVMTRDQPPVEIALNLDGRKITKTVISNINKDFSLTNEARMPSEGMG